MLTPVSALKAFVSHIAASGAGRSEAGKPEIGCLAQGQQGVSQALVFGGGGTEGKPGDEALWTDGACHCQGIVGPVRPNSAIQPVLRAWGRRGPPGILGE